MVDTRSPEARRRIMQSVRTANTGPEIAVRQILHADGYRFRLHRKDLPGTPDIVFSKRRKIVFVHGCFWHGHGCPKGRLPKTRADYWVPKIAKNQRRDLETTKILQALGWEVLTVWQCEIKSIDSLRLRLSVFLGPSKKTIDNSPQFP